MDSGAEVWNAFKDQLFELAGFGAAAGRSVLRFLRRRFILLFLAAVLGGGCGYGWGVWRGPVYKAETIIGFTLLTKKIYGEMVLKLDAVIQSDDTATAAKLLGVENDLASKIHSIKATNVLGDPLHTDVNSDPSPFRVQVEVTDPNILLPLEDALIRYFDSPLYVRERLEFNVVSGNQQVQDLEERIRKVEADHSTMLQSAVPMENLSAINGLRAELDAELVKVRTRLQFNHNTEIFDGFITTSTNRNNPWRHGVLWSIAAIVVAALFGCWREIQI